MRYAYVYFTDPGRADRVRLVAPEHSRYWRGLDQPNYLGGPFADGTGGLVIFEADSIEEAQDLLNDDPFRREGLIANGFTSEWHVE